MGSNDVTIHGYPPVGEGYDCEWNGPGLDPPKWGCKNPAVGFSGPADPQPGSQQHPLCEEHLDPKWHPPGSNLHHGTITHPCQHAQPARAEGERT